MRRILPCIVYASTLFSLQCLVAAQIAASLDVLSVPIGVNIGNDPSASATPAATSPTANQNTAAPEDPTTTNIIISNVVQTTVEGSTTLVITSAMSLPIVPTITSGATVFTANQQTYTVSVASGKTIIMGSGGSVSATVMGDKTVIVINSIITAPTQTIFGTSLITTTTTSVSDTALASWSSSSSSTTNTSSSGMNHDLHKQGSLGVGAGVGIGVGAMALLVVLGIVAFIYLRRRRRQQQQQQQQRLHETGVNSTAAAAARRGIVGGTWANDSASTIAPSSPASSTFAKVELDSHPVHVIQAEPAELMGDMPPPRPLEPDGFVGRSTTMTTTTTTDTAVSRPVSPAVTAPSRSLTQASLVSPLERTNSGGLDENWPLAPPPPPPPSSRRS